MTLQTLIFDLGNVLVFFDHEKMVQQLAKLCALSPQTIKSVLYALVLSHLVKSRKPEPTIYQKALVVAECHKENCLFVDDILENVEGARRVGIPAHHFVGTDSFLALLKRKGIG